MSKYKEEMNKSYGNFLNGFYEKYRYVPSGWSVWESACNWQAKRVSEDDIMNVIIKVSGVCSGEIVMDINDVRKVAKEIIKLTKGEKDNEN